jgi:glycosyltransferase involved in cell wall biosynthesis
MKIVFLINRNDRSGGKRVINALSEQMQKSGHNVLLIIRPGEPQTPQFSQSYLCKHIELPAPLKFISKTPLAYLAFLLAIPKCDVIIATYYPTALIATFYRILNQKVRSYYFVQGLEGEFSGGIKKLFAWLTYQLPIRIIVNSSWMETQVKARRRGGRIHGRILLGLDNKTFKPKGVGHHQYGKPVIIGTVGRTLPIKGLPIFWELVQILQNQVPIKALVVSPEIIEVPHRLSMAVQVTSATNDLEMVKFYQALDVFVSTSFRESFSYPPLEAMACGIPTVITDSGGCGEYARNNFNTCIAPPGDVSKLNEYVLRILNSSSFAEEIIRNGIETAKRFSWKTSVEQMITLLQK